VDYTSELTNFVLNNLCNGWVYRENNITQKGKGINMDALKIILILGAVVLAGLVFFYFVIPSGAMCSIILLAIVFEAGGVNSVRVTKEINPIIKFGLA
jgi:hypothetical protein